MTPNALLPGVILLSPGEGRQYSCGPVLGGVHVDTQSGARALRRSTNSMSDSGRTIEASQIEPREAFRIEEAVNLDDLAARNRKPSPRRAARGHDDNSRGAIDERRNFDCGGLRRRDRSTRNFGRSTANERQCTPRFPAIRSQHHVGSNTATSAAKSPRCAAAKNASTTCR
jgi:hypothetical protein